MFYLVLSSLLMYGSAFYLSPYRVVNKNFNNEIIKIYEPFDTENRNNVLFFTGANSIIPGEVYNSFMSNLAQQNIHKAQLIFFLIYLFVVTFSLPFASLLTVLGSALFGWIALLIILFAASFGASLLFIAARTILSDWFYEKTSSQNSIIPPNF